MAKKILIAEDEKSIGQALVLKLEGAGFETKHVLDGEEALKALEDEKFDLAILDLMMPKLDGFGVLTGMKEKKISTPAIVASNLSQVEDEEKAKSLGAKDYFVKSDVPLTEIVSKIENILK